MDGTRAGRYVGTKRQGHGGHKAGAKGRGSQRWAGKRDQAGEGKRVATRYEVEPKRNEAGNGERDEVETERGAGGGGSGERIPKLGGRSARG